MTVLISFDPKILKIYSKWHGKIKQRNMFIWILCSIKKGGPSPSSNTALAAILEKARELDVPKEVVERNIKRASEKGQDTYTEKVYEV
jgi:transcriptional/translational regulatory protein YebC/TACO1